MDNLKMFSKIADILTSAKDFEVQMNSIFDSLCKQTKICQAYIFVVDDDLSATKILQWNNSMKDSKTNKQDRISFENMKILEKIFIEKGKLYTDNVKELTTQLVDSLMLQGVSSVVAFPFFVSKKVAGFIQFNLCNNKISWGESDLLIFSTIASILSNVYEKKYCLEKRLEDKENFQHFFNSIDDFIFIGNNNCEIIFTNDLVTKKLGYSKEELMNMKIIDIHALEQRDQAEKFLGEIISGKRENCLLNLMAKDETIIPVEAHAWLGKWNKQDCIFGVCRNLSKEQESLANFKAIFENNPAPMAINSLLEKRFIDVNFAFVEKTGYSFEDVVGKTTDELGLFVYLDEINIVTKELSENDKFNNKDIHVRCKNGNVLTGLFSGEIIHGQKGAYLLTIMVDITEIKSVKELYENEKNKLESVIEVTRLGIWEWNIKTGETIFNERWPEMLGYSLDEIMPTTLETWKKFTHTLMI